MDDTIWGPWIEHDGRTAHGMGDGVHFQAACIGDGERPIEGSAIMQNYPSWFWTWRRVRVGWFRREYRRVCDNPAYAPIARYRIRKPSAMTMLEEIAAGIREPADA